MSSILGKAKQIFDQVTGQGRDQIDGLRRRRRRSTLTSELGDLTYRRASGEVSLDADIDRVVEQLKALDSETDQNGDEASSEAIESTE